MSKKPYPSLMRAKRAFWTGVKASRRAKSGNPYRNRKLRELWEREKALAKANPGLVIPVRFRPRAAHRPVRRE